MAGAICAASGAATAGLGCAVGLAIMALQLAFDGFNIAMDIIDPNGYSMIIYKADIKVVAEVTGQWVQSELSDGKPNYLDEEVFFNEIDFLYEYDDDGNIQGNEYWCRVFEKYRDEYMTGIGITGDWRARIPSLDVSNANTPGVLSPLTLALQEYKKEIIKLRAQEKKKKTNVILFTTVLFVIIFLTIIIFFFIINGSEQGANS
jgi:hypothetical protein